MKKYLCGLVFLLVGVMSRTQSLSKNEQQIVNGIDTDMSSTLALLKESVNINSGTFNIEGVKKPANYMGKN